MGSHKRQKKPKRPTGMINVGALRERVEENLRAQAPAAEAPSGVIGKLQSLDPNVREEGCEDLAHLAAEPCHFEQLCGHNVPAMLRTLLGDPSIGVRAAAAVALRSLLVTGGDAMLDAFITGPFCVSLSSEAAAVRAAGLADRGSAQAAHEVDEEDEDEEGDGKPAPVPYVACVAAYLRLAAVAAEGCEAAAVALGSDVPFMQLVVGCVCDAASSAGVAADVLDCAIAAAELLHVLSEDSEPVATFLTQGGLSHEQGATLNALISPATAVSPAFVYLAVRLSGALFNASPTAESAQRVMPTLLCAMQVLPGAEWRTVMSLSSDHNEMALEVRLSGLDQSYHRLQALEVAMDVVSAILNAITEQQPEDCEDEVAFANNPYAGIIADTPCIPQLVQILRDILGGARDALVDQSLRQPVVGNGRLSSLQHAYVSVEVSALALASSLLLLLPVNSFGPSHALWIATMEGIAQRHALLGTVDGSSVPGVLLQLESLAEIAWTVVRKDPSIPLQPAHVDELTRVAWERGVSETTRTFLVGCVGTIGSGNSHANDPDVVAGCARFCLALMTADKEDMTVRAEAANSLMDLFSDERFDASAYVPLHVHDAVRALLPMLKQHCKAMGRHSSSNATRAHLQEIATNLTEFIKYKERHVRWQ